MPERFILLPPQGVRERETASDLLMRIPAASSIASPSSWMLTYTSQPMWERQDIAMEVPLTVIDTVAEEGPKLVELEDDAALVVRALVPELRLEPLREYRTTTVAATPPIALPNDAAGAPATTIEVHCANTGVPIGDAQVTAIVDLSRNLGDQGVTDSTGTVALRLGPNPLTVDELRVERPPRGWWGAWGKHVAIDSPHPVELQPVDLGPAAANDALRHFYGSSPPGAGGIGVRIGVLDTGINLDHPHLTVADGQNTVTGEQPGDYGDNGVGHGTHVAGIIAGKGSAPTGISGLAPQAELWSFRVFGKASETATNYSIMKALWLAQLKGCHLVNLSLGATPPDQALKDAIDDAEEHGVVVLAAAGNESCSPVAVPGCYANAVTALGRRGTFPSAAREAGDIGPPAGTDPSDFFAGFSNYGQQVDFTAPGVGIVSTVPGGYAPDRGTSMAAAAATGIAARLLSDQPALLAMPADSARSQAVLNLLGSSAVAKGFGFSHEGFGML